MLDLAPGDVLLRDFWQGRIFGKEEEKQRVAHIIHDSFCPELLAATFLIHGTQKHLEKSYPEEAKQLAKANESLSETIQRLVAELSSPEVKTGKSQSA